MSSLHLVSERPCGVFQKAMRWLAAVLGILFLCLPVFSQGNFGRILGTVTDQTGGVLAGATVTVIDTQRGLERTLATDNAGEYNAPNLTPGTYTVRVEAKGFKTLDRQNVVLEVGKEVRVDLTPQPGDQAQTVTVTEAIPLVDAATATLGGTLNSAEITDMPLNGRNYQNLLALRPGINVQPGGGPWVQSTNGVRPDESVWMVDGIINTNMYDARPILNMPSPFSDGASILPVDAIQEFNLEENPKAEYGWKPGAVVNVGIRSGTNTFHGTTYGFYRSAAWDARNLFNPDVRSRPSCGNDDTQPCKLTPVQLKQFGGVLGGPIKKDKLFFLVGYEGLRSLIGNAIVTGGVPETNSTGSKQNSMVDAIMALQAKGIAVSPVSLALSGCPSGVLTTASVCTPPSYSWPINTTGGTGFIAPFPNTNVTDNGLTKFDYHINSKHSLNGMLFIGNYTGDGMDHPFVNNLFRDTNLDRVYTVGADWVWAANSRLVNDARFGYDRVWFKFLTDDGTKLADGIGYPINTGVTQFPGLPNINLSGFEKLGSWHNRPQSWATHYYDYQDNLSYLMGKHTFRFGGEFATVDITNAIPDTGRGLIAFKGKQLTAMGLTDCKKHTVSCPLEDFFAGLPSGGNILTGVADRHETWKSIAVFFQDDWRVGSRLTLNLGLRYSYNSPIKEVNGLWGNFDPTKGMVQTGGTLWNPDRKDFSPRAGFAYDVTGRGTTVVRGGFSIIYSTITAVTFLNQNGFTGPGATSVSVAAVPTGAVLETNGLGLAGGTAGGGQISLQSAALPGSALHWNTPPVFPSSATPQCGDGVSLDASQCNIMAVDPNLTTPYITNWSLGIQHAFNNNLSLEVGYVGDHGSRLTGFRDLNQTVPSLVNATSNPLGQPFYSRFPYLNWIIQNSNDGRSNYNSLQATLTKRVSHGLNFVAGYTYAHGLDTGSLNRTGYLPQDSTNPGAEYASGDFDMRHRFTFTTTYSIPGVRGFAQLLEGWKLNAIVSVQSAQPWQTYDSSNDFRGGDFTDRWNIKGNPADFSSGAYAIPFCSGFGTAVTCVQTSGTSGQDNPLSASFNSAAATLCQASAADAGNLAADGCFVSPNGRSVITPPANGTFGNIGRNIFRDSGFKNVDFSVFKTFTFKDRYSAQFRAEVFNLFNHPIAANPYGSSNGYGVGNDFSTVGGGGGFGCGCATADVAAGSPQIGSGGARGIQLGLKLAF
ncbi:MAG TPA: TonB-dependent receptor [Gemmata sp.]|nr:TonB-dependent receptor [Gemmata sp.]